MTERELPAVCMPGELESLHESTNILRAPVRQLADLVMAMQRRMDELEALQRQATLTHGEVKRLNGMIRARAKEIRDRYGLDDKSEKAIRAAIRKDTLARAGVRDLHDIPLSALPGTQRAIAAWTNIRLIMERRGT